jgi:hypothetical protein
MTNEKIYEDYGWQAHNHGFFEEWREEVSKRMILEKYTDRSTISMEVYSELINKKNIKDDGE